MLGHFKKFITKILTFFFYEDVEKNLINSGKILSIKHSKFKKIKDISNVEFRVFSQWGEDGIIDWLTNQVPNIPKNFLEIGTEDYKESNTRFLLINKNWNGILIEGNENDVKKIKNDRIYWKHNIKIINKFINLSNIDSILNNLDFKNKFGLISLDIDGIDYWILKKLKKLKPVIFICEFNPIFGHKQMITVPYKKSFNRHKEHYSNSYFGTSIAAIQNLLKKDYLFIGSNSAGNNGFFINKNYNKFFYNKIKNYKIFESKYRENRNKKNKLTFFNKDESIQTIKNKKILDIKKNKILKIHDLFGSKI